MKKYTTVSVKHTTLAQLVQICKKNQSYDEIIQKLLENWNEK